MARWGHRLPLGLTTAAVDRADVLAIADALGDAGRYALALDARVSELLPGITSLSDLSAPVALDYIERLRHPMPDLTLAVAATTLLRGYIAHLAVEADPEAFAVGDIPVFADFPPLRRGRLPADLASRVVKGSRRHFDLVRAVSAEVWEGFSACVVCRAHTDVAADQLIAAEVIDGLLRFGWVLRQADIHYGLEPERHDET